MIVRRKFLLGLVSALAAPAIVPVRSLMAMPRAPLQFSIVPWPAAEPPFAVVPWPEHPNCRCTYYPFARAIMDGADKYGKPIWRFSKWED